jgi:hypothetical protein
MRVVGSQLTSSNVVPVGIIWGKLFEVGSLDEVNPLWQLDGAAALEVSGIGCDELLGRNVLDGNSDSLRHLEREREREETQQ